MDSLIRFAWGAARRVDRDQVVSVASKGIGAGVGHAVEAALTKAEVGGAEAKAAGVLVGGAATMASKAALDEAADRAARAVAVVRQQVDDARKFYSVVAGAPMGARILAARKLGEYESRASHPIAKEGLALVRREVRGY